MSTNAYLVCVIIILAFSAGANFHLVWEFDVGFENFLDGNAKFVASILKHCVLASGVTFTLSPLCVIGYLTNHEIAQAIGLLGLASCVVAIFLLSVLYMWNFSEFILDTNDWEGSIDGQHRFITGDEVNMRDVLLRIGWMKIVFDVMGCLTSISAVCVMMTDDTIDPVTDFV